MQSPSINVSIQAQRVRANRKTCVRRPAAKQTGWALLEALTQFFSSGAIAYSIYYTITTAYPNAEYLWGQSIIDGVSGAAALFKFFEKINALPQVTAPLLTDLHDLGDMFADSAGTLQYAADHSAFVNGPLSFSMAAGIGIFGTVAKNHAQSGGKLQFSGERMYELTSISGMLAFLMRIVSGFKGTAPSSLITGLSSLLLGCINAFIGAVLSVGSCRASRNAQIARATLTHAINAFTTAYFFFISNMDRITSDESGSFSDSSNTEVSNTSIALNAAGTVVVFSLVMLVNMSNTIEKLNRSRLARFDEEAGPSEQVHVANDESLENETAGLLESGDGSEAALYGSLNLR